MSFYDDMNLVMKILEHPNQNLGELARLSRFDPYSFYQEADLRGANLSGQDLRGLNFDGTDLCSSDLSDTKFDSGAFNRSRIDTEHVGSIDEFDLTIFDVLNIRKIFTWDYFLLSFRKGILDEFISFFRLTYGDFARMCMISTATLRSARSGYPVINFTASHIVDGLIKIIDSVDTENRFRSVRHLHKPDEIRLAISKIKQPNLAAYRDNYYGPRSQIERDKLFVRYKFLVDRIVFKDHP